MGKDGRRGGRSSLDWQNAGMRTKLSMQNLFDRNAERHDREVEKFLARKEKKLGKSIERDWDD